MYGGIMKKRMFFVLLMTLFVASVACGCGKTTYQLVKENMSEITNVYYYGENDDFYCSLSSGEREKNYLMDGRKSETVEFALFSLSFSKPRQNSMIKVFVTIGQTREEKEFELNTLNNKYMFDLGKSVGEGEEVFVEFEKSVLKLECLSKDFGVNADKALRIASEELEKQILACKSFNTLNAECYLTVLDKKANHFDGVFWCFSILNTQNQTFSIIISTKDGAVLAKN